MSKNVKKRLIALMFTLALCTALMLPVFAATNETPILQGTYVYENLGNAQKKDGQVLNAYTSTQVNNGVNVTTYPKDNSNSQRWNLYTYMNGTNRLTTALNNSYAIEYYWGSNNPGNAQLYHYTLSNNDETTTKDCAVMQGYGTFYLRYYSDKYLTASTVESHYGSTTYYNVIWASASASSSDVGTRQWLAA